MSKMVVYLKSGASFEVDVEEFSTRCDGAKFTSLSWKTPDGFTAKLHEVCVTEIAAIVEKREEAK